MAKSSVHSLFPPDKGEAPAEVVRLTILRKLEGGGHFRYPKPLSGDDVPDHTALYELTGGGTYDVIGYDSKGQSSARDQFSFEGEPKVWAVGNKVQTQQQAPQGQPQQMQQQPAPPTITMADVMALLHKQDSNQQQMVQNVTQNFMTIFAGLQSTLTQVALAIATKKDDSAPLLKAIIDMKAQPTGMGTGDLIKFLKEGSALMKGGGEPAQDGDNLLETLATFAQGAAAFGGMQPQPPAQPAQAAAQPVQRMTPRAAAVQNGQRKEPVPPPIVPAEGTPDDATHG